MLSGVFWENPGFFWQQACFLAKILHFSDAEKLIVRITLPTSSFHELPQNHNLYFSHEH